MHTVIIHCRGVTFKNFDIIDTRNFKSDFEENKPLF